MAYIDGYGNLKTTLNAVVSVPSVGSTIVVRIGDVTQHAVVSDGSFAVAPGQLAHAPRSSGWTLANGDDYLWMELFLRGGNAAELFQHPRVGAQITLEAGP